MHTHTRHHAPCTTQALPHTHTPFPCCPRPSCPPPLPTHPTPPPPLPTHPTPLPQTLDLHNEGPASAAQLSLRLLPSSLDCLALYSLSVAAAPPLVLAAPSGAAARGSKGGGGTAGAAAAAAAGVWLPACRTANFVFCAGAPLSRVLPCLPGVRSLQLQCQHISAADALAVGRAGGGALEKLQASSCCLRLLVHPHARTACSCMQRCMHAPICPPRFFAKKRFLKCRVAGPPASRRCMAHGMGAGWMCGHEQQQQQQCRFACRDRHPPTRHFCLFHLISSSTCTRTHVHTCMRVQCRSRATATRRSTTTRWPRC